MKAESTRAGSREACEERRWRRELKLLAEGRTPADKAAEKAESAAETSPDLVHVMSVCVSCCSLVAFLTFLLLPLGFSGLCTVSCIVGKLRMEERRRAVPEGGGEINPSN